MSALSLWDDFEIPPQARRVRITLDLYGRLSAYIPKRPGAYLRISSDRFGLEAGVGRQPAVGPTRSGGCDIRAESPPIPTPAPPRRRGDSCQGSIGMLLVKGAGHAADPVAQDRAAQ